MKNLIKSKAGKLAALILILIVSLTAALYSAASVTVGTYSADEGVYAEISGDTAGVNIYVSGEGVTWDANVGKYFVPDNTRVEVTVVNNATVSSSAITVTDDSGANLVEGRASSNFAVANVGTNGINIGVKAALDTGRGTSLSSAYLISSAEDLIALSKLLAARELDFDSSYYEGDSQLYEAAKTFAGYLGEFGLDDSSWYSEDGTFNGGVAAVEQAVFDARAKLSTAYFRLADNVMVNASLTESTNYREGYFGLGSRRGAAFSGVFDFNGHTVTLNVSLAEADADNFSAVDHLSGVGVSSQHRVLSVGFFNYIYGNGSDACAIIGADVRGTIALSANVENTTGEDFRAYVGGIAGSIGKNVVLDKVQSRVSISVRTGGDSDTGVSVYAGGVFGYSGADINYWSDVSYVGNYSEISVTCSDNGTDHIRTVVGVLAGVMQNVYVNGFTADLRGANILADSTIYGSSIAGGLAGIVYGGKSSYPEIDDVSRYSLTGVQMRVSGSTVSAHTAAQYYGAIDPDKFINNVDSSDPNVRSAAVAIAGGLIGMNYAIESEYIDLEIGGGTFTRSDASGAFNVRASTSDASSCGMTFAGGVVGYVVDTNAAMNIGFTNEDPSATGAIFDCPVTITSMQNGNGPAYAGGIFGYNTFNLLESAKQITLNSSEDCPVDVVAEQRETATSYDIYKKLTPYSVYAGFFTSKLPQNFSISGFGLNAVNSSVIARRLTGSTAVGDIAAGAIAGYAASDRNSYAAISSVDVNLNACSVRALGYSFDSQYSPNVQGNNVYAGGLIGYVRNYGAVNDYGGGYVGLSDISVTFSGTHANGYAVHGVQNAVAGTDNYCSEGYVGGMFGMMEGGYASDLSVDGTARGDTVIYFNSTNNPNTANVGGIIGATKVYGSSQYIVQNCTAINMHIAGRAYIKSNPNRENDIYVGGAIGVLGTAVSGFEYENLASNIRVENSAIEAIGEEAMLTYAGGIVGGLWWVGSSTIDNCESINNDVLASSATSNTFAGGISGLVQRGSITNCKVLGSTVEAVTYSKQTQAYAYAAGICSRLFSEVVITNNISNAVVTASAPSGSSSVAVMAGIGVSDGVNLNTNPNQATNNYFVAANINTSSFTEAYAFKWLTADWWGNDKINTSGNYAVGIVNGQTDHLKSNGRQEVNINNNTPNIYSGCGISLTGMTGDKTMNATMAGNPVQLRIVGDSAVFSEAGSLAIKRNESNTGTSFGQIIVTTADKREVQFCSYPITAVESSMAQNIKITATNLGADVTSENSQHYTKLNNVTYFQIYAGQAGSTQNVLVTNDAVYAPNLYLVSDKSLLVGYNSQAADGQVAEGQIDDEQISDQEINDIISAIGSPMYPDDVSGYFNVSLTEDGRGLNVSPVLGKTDGAAIILQYEVGYNSYEYVVIEVVPNAITGVNIRPAEDTPARAQGVYDGQLHYIYSAGDTVRIEAEVLYRFGFNRYIVDVQFDGGLIYGSGDAEVQPNGTVMIGDNVTNSSLIKVECSPIVSGLVMDDGFVAPEFIIEVARRIQVTPNIMAGANYSPQNDNDAVYGHDFTFMLEPNPGHGLNPDTEIILADLNGATIYSFGFELPEKRIGGKAGTYDWYSGNGAVTSAQETVSATAPYVYTITIPYGNESWKITYTLDIETGIYTITLPEELFKVDNLDEVFIDAQFSKMYSIMFDVGAWAAISADDVIGTRYFIYRVKSDTPITTALRDEIFGYFDELYGNRFTALFDRQGFTFKGFYATDSASSLSSYGVSFSDYCAAGDQALASGGQPEGVRGSMNYYARWNYTVVLNAPQGIRINGGLNSSLLEHGSIIPIDILHGFSFTLAGNYMGTPRIQVFTYSNGKLVEIGYRYSSGVYTVSDADITGTLYIYVYGDNLAVVAGENDNDAGYSVETALRGDGIFTVRYAVNHGSGDAQTDGGVQFRFSSELPAGTQARLFYQINGKPYSAGIYKFTSATQILTSSDFTALTGSPATAQGGMLFAYDGAISGESYYLVVTLPDNVDNLAEGRLTVSVSAAQIALERTEYQTEGVVQDASQEDKIQSAELSRDQITSTLETYIDIYGAVIRSGSYNGGKLNYTAADSGSAGAPEDIRHRSSYYVWRIEGTDISVAGTSEYFSTDTATYIIIGDYTVQSFSVTLGGSVTKIELLEVINSQYPASGTVLLTI